MLKKLKKLLREVWNNEAFINAWNTKDIIKRETLMQLKDNVIKTPKTIAEYFNSEVQDIVVCLYEEYQNLEGNSRYHGGGGKFMVTTGTFTPYVMPDILMWFFKNEIEEDIENLIQAIIATAFHEFIHGLVPANLTWSEQIPQALEMITIDWIRDKPLFEKHRRYTKFIEKVPIIDR